MEGDHDGIIFPSENMLSENLSKKHVLTLTDEQLVQLGGIIEFLAITILSWLVAEYIEKSFLSAGLIPLHAVFARWIGFFLMLLIYYGLIRVHIRVKKEF